MLQCFNTKSGLKLILQGFKNIVHWKNKMQGLIKLMLQGLNFAMSATLATKPSQFHLYPRNLERPLIF